MAYPGLSRPGLAPPPEKTVKLCKIGKIGKTIPWGASASQHRGAWGKNPLPPPPRDGPGPIACRHI